MDEFSVLRLARIGAIAEIDEAQNKLAELELMISAKTKPEPPKIVVSAWTQPTKKAAKKLAKKLAEVTGDWKVTTGRPKKKFSAATRKRMSDAQKLRRKNMAEGKAAA